MTNEEKTAIAVAIAKYMASEGCGCCENSVEHAAAAAVLGELLDVPKYHDNSGYDFMSILARSNNEQSVPD